MQQILLSHGHPYVEIGGVKWATMNVGAKSVTDAGLYFAWGETRGYKPEEIDNSKYFGWSSYKFDVGCLSKYYGEDNLTTLQPQDDPVHVAWRGGWRLPTYEEFLLLRECTNHCWTDNYKDSGVAGLVLTDKIDPSKELFFPAAGCISYWLVNYAGLFGYYWSSSSYDGIGNNTLIRCFFFNRNLEVWYALSFPFEGQCVRGVLG